MEGEERVTPAGTGSARRAPIPPKAAEAEVQREGQPRAPVHAGHDHRQQRQVPIWRKGQAIMLMRQKTALLLEPSS